MSARHDDLRAALAEQDGSDIPPGRVWLDDYMAEVMRDPERAKAMEEARPVVLRMMNRALLDEIAALRTRAERAEAQSMKLRVLATDVTRWDWSVDNDADCVRDVDTLRDYLAAIDRTQGGDRETNG